MSYDWDDHTSQIGFDIRNGRNPFEVDAELRLPKADLGEAGKVLIAVNMTMPVEGEVKVREIQHRAVVAAIALLQE